MRPSDDKDSVDDFINLNLLGKLLVVAILTPAWLPVLKELYREIDSSLEEEGGIFGEAPDQETADAIAKKRRLGGGSLISVPLGQEPKAKGRTAPGATGRPTKSETPTKRRGF